MVQMSPKTLIAIRLGDVLLLGVHARSNARLTATTFGVHLRTGPRPSPVHFAHHRYG